MRGNGKWYRPGRVIQRLDEHAQRTAIRDLELRGALEFYGVKFNRQGAALCPFHKEKTASFRVKGHYWHCFGCGESGDLITFVRKLLGASYADALRVICKDFGIPTGSAAKIQDLETLDKVKLERYYIVQRYAELLRLRDIYTDVYLFACDVLDYIKQYGGGARLDNDRFVNAQYAVLRARNALEQVESDCREYLRDNPSATPEPPSGKLEHAGIKLPPAPVFAKSLKRTQDDDPDQKEVKKYD